ncbi:MBL fold metallo-hydrolase [Telluribacter sp. SYSU D00476]|uniref:MBL fold metallo-hydrolase n=1 Tax=Telluribacter sp. SYSU D00476 TaxID=2811430 RepID=UPI001FF12833|nr:MBL fold metallo-hydrolase [Telluribacter sp. SYSU D00476]
MKRRQFLQNSTALVGAFHSVQLHELNHMGTTMFPAADDVVTRHVGNIKTTIYKDTTHKYMAKNYFINAAPEELTQALTKYQITPDNIPSPFIAVLLEQGDKRILIDTGLGFSEKPVMVGNNPVPLNGRLNQLLQQQGIKGSDITDVVITHLHPDHIGGVYSDEGALLFPNARFHIHEDEWSYWFSSQSVNQPAHFRFFIDRNVAKLKDGNLHLIKGDFVDLLPGVTAVKAEGHTPGQLALIIHSQNDRMLYTSDAFLHPIHIERLDWQTSYDLDHAKARQTRMKLLDLAHKDNMLVNAFHFDFPGLGRVDKTNNNWTWRYTNK